jgi:hypothetical protein
MLKIKCTNSYQWNLRFAQEAFGTDMSHAQIKTSGSPFSRFELTRSKQFSLQVHSSSHSRCYLKLNLVFSCKPTNSQSVSKRSDDDRSWQSKLTIPVPLQSSKNMKIRLSLVRSSSKLASTCRIERLSCRKQPVRYATDPYISRETRFFENT